MKKTQYGGDTKFSLFWMKYVQTEQFFFPPVHAYGNKLLRFSFYIRNIWGSTAPTGIFFSFYRMQMRTFSCILFGILIWKSVVSSVIGKPALQIYLFWWAKSVSKVTKLYPHKNELRYRFLTWRAAHCKACATQLRRIGQHGVICTPVPTASHSVTHARSSGQQQIWGWSCCDDTHSVAWW